MSRDHIAPVSAMSKTNVSRSPLSTTLVCPRTDGRFVVRDRNGQALSYVYFKDQHGRRSVGTVFTRDEARHLAAAVAKLPELWRKD
jgi:hypothetical protein